MMRIAILFFVLSVSVEATAQLRVPEAPQIGELGAAAGAKLYLGRPVFPAAVPGTRVPAPISSLIPLAQPAPFEFAKAKPYLAFFCRLELDIEEATRFPVRFRLGEVKTWQQELSKRD